jgi:hypothetical protein
MTFVARRTVQDRVARGAALLDEKQPGWASKLNFDIFNIDGCYSCVLGQVFGHYVRGLDFLQQGNNFSVEHGFITERDKGEPVMEETRYLEVAWAAETVRRLKA